MKTKLIQRIQVALSGLACACAAGFTLPAHAQITGTNQIALNVFDGGYNVGHIWSYAFFYSWNFPGVNSAPFDPQPGIYGIVDEFTDPLPANGTAVFQFTFTNAPYEGPVTTNGGGHGVGTGIPLVWTEVTTDFTSTNLSDYIVSFDARVEGLLPGQTTAAGRLEFRMNAPGGPNGYAVYKQIPFSPGSNWTHFVFTLDQGGFDQGTSDASFAAGVAAGISQVLAQFVFNEPNPQFGFDDNNVFLVDNIKLGVIQYAGPVVVPPKIALAVLDWNFDDKPLWYGNGGYAWSQLAPNSMPSSVYNIADPTTGVGGSNAWTILMDNSTLAPPNTPQWAGTGMGGGGPGNYTQFNTSDRSSYRITFDARVEGMAPDKTTIYGIEQGVHLRAPDDTLLPADGDTNPDELVRLNFAFNVQSNWTTYTFTFNQGGIGGGSLGNFDNHFGQISEVAVEWGIPNAQSSDWEFDNNNKVFIDNYKIERVYTATPPLSVQTVGNNVVVTWAQPSTGSAKLQSSTTVNGTYTDVIGATSPYPSPIASGPKYYRTKWIAP